MFVCACSWIPAFISLRLNAEIISPTINRKNLEFKSVKLGTISRFVIVEKCNRVVPDDDCA